MNTPFRLPPEGLGQPRPDDDETPADSMMPAPEDDEEGEADNAGDSDDA